MFFPSLSDMTASGKSILEKMAKQSYDNVDHSLIKVGEGGQFFCQQSSEDLCSEQKVKNILHAEFFSGQCWFLNF